MVAETARNAGSARSHRPVAKAEPQLRTFTDEQAKAQAKEAFSKLSVETSSLDVLQRCRKLNEFLATDFLHKGPDSRAELQQILEILGAGPKRPACLNKPTLAEQAAAAAAAKPGPSRPSLADSAAGCNLTSSGLDGAEADRLLGLIEEDEGETQQGSKDQSPTTTNSASPPAVHPSSALQPASSSPPTAAQQGPAGPPVEPPVARSAEPADDVDDLIGLLNTGTSCRVQAPCVPASVAAHNALQAQQEQARQQQLQQQGTQSSPTPSSGQPGSVAQLVPQAESPASPDKAPTQPANVAAPCQGTGVPPASVDLSQEQERRRQLELADALTQQAQRLREQQEAETALLKRLQAAAADPQVDAAHNCKDGSTSSNAGNEIPNAGVAAAGSQPSLAEVDRSSTQSFKQRAAAQAAELARQAAAAAAQAAKEARERAQAMAAAAQEARQKAAQEAEEQRQRDAAAVAEQDQRRKEQEEARATAAAAAAQEEFVKQRRSSAAVTIQKYWRRHAAQAAAAHLRAVRQLCRRVAAHTIQRAWRGWRVNRGWVLGPLRVPAARPLSSSTTTTGTSSCSQQRPCSASSSSGTGTTPPPSGGCTPSPRRSLQHQPGSMKSPGASPQQQPAGKPPTGAASGDHSKVLSKPLRVRSTADARLAPEAAGGEGPPSSAKSGSPDQRGSPGGGETSGASKNRVVASTKARVADVVADEGVRRGELERRAIMAASEHRDAAQVMALIRSSSART